MANQEKVINALEHCIEGCFDNCPYEYGGAVTLEYCRSDLMLDALELLEDDEIQLAYRNETIKAYEGKIERLNELLKEQERKHGIWVPLTGMAPPEYHGHKICSICECLAPYDPIHVGREELSPYCPGCGAKMEVTLDD